MFLLTFLQRWFRSGRPQPRPSVPYEVTCVCGQTVRGLRQSHHQVAACPACGQKCFILPCSSWPSSSDAAEGSPAAPAAPSAWPPPLWRLVLLILGGGLAAMGVVFLVLSPYLSRSASRAPAEAASPDVRTHIAAGRRALADGNFRLALRELNAAVALRDGQPGLLSPDDHRHLSQLQRQSDLLAHLLDRSLQEILQQGAHLRDDEEWHEKFADYRGQAVLFDDVLRRDPAGRPVLAVYVVRAGAVEARVALEDVKLLQDLPLQRPQRCLFGVRLASCQREEGGVWVIRFEPDSGVLLTDPDAAAACCPAPLDEELQDVLRRQQSWLQP